MRTATTLGLVWTTSNTNGGSPVIDYTVSSNSGSGNDFTVVENGSGILTLSFTVEKLIPEKTYKFKV